MAIGKIVDLDIRFLVVKKCFPLSPRKIINNNAPSYYVKKILTCFYVTLNFKQKAMAITFSKTYLIGYEKL